MRRFLIAVTAAAAFFVTSVPLSFAVASDNANCNGQLASAFATGVALHPRLSHASARLSVDSYAAQRKA